jgi:hypothetical protein
MSKANMYLHSNVENYRTSESTMKSADIKNSGLITMLDTSIARARNLAFESAKAIGYSSPIIFCKEFNNKYRDYGEIIGSYVKKELLSAYGASGSGKNFTAISGETKTKAKVNIQEIIKKINTGVNKISDRDQLVLQEAIQTSFAHINGKEGKLLGNMLFGKNNKTPSYANYQGIIGEITTAMVGNFINMGKGLIKNKVIGKYDITRKNKKSKEVVYSKHVKTDVALGSITIPITISVKNVNVSGDSSGINLRVNSPGKGSIRKFLSTIMDDTNSRIVEDDSINKLLFDLYNILHFEQFGSFDFKSNVFEKANLTRDKFKTYEDIMKILNYTAGLWIMQGTANIFDSSIPMSNRFQLIKSEFLGQKSSKTAMAGYFFVLGKEIVPIYRILEHIKKVVNKQIKTGVTNTGGIRGSFHNSQNILGKAFMSEDPDAGPVTNLATLKMRAYDRTLTPAQKQQKIGGQTDLYSNNIYKFGASAFKAYEQKISLSMRLKMNVTEFSKLLT